MITISLCMIVKNEEAVLEHCLKSTKGIFDEIIIVDTGSTDNTLKIACKFTKKIFHFDWVDDFSKARNYAFSFASSQYIMWLDADDVILEEDRKKILQLKKKLSTAYDIITMKYNVGFDEKGNTTFYSTRERIFKREKNYKWVDPVHEYIPMVGNVLQVTDIAITHRSNKVVHSDRNLKIYEKILKRDGELSPRSQYYYARELKDHSKWQDSVEWFKKFLDEGKGWKEDNIASCYSLAICYKMLNESQKEFDALQRSFTYDAPRAEICCLIGYYYKYKSDFSVAGAWFETALNLPKTDSIGFVLKDYHTYIPALELAVCYDKLEQFEKANYFNEIAGKEKPESKEYLQNKNYFVTKL